MPTTGPTRSLVKIQLEAQQYREYMFNVYLQRGMSPAQAKECAAAATDTQLAIRMRELEQKRDRRAKEAKERRQIRAAP